MEALKKMSAKSILGNVKRYIPLDDKRDVIDGQKVPLFRVYGVARGLKKGQSDNGDWTAFVGEFRAETAPDKDGVTEMYFSTTLFLPAAAEMMLVTPVLENDGSGVEFAFDIGIIGRPSSSVGYEFTADAPLATKANDVMTPLANKLPPPKWAKPAALPNESGAEPGKEVPTDPAETQAATEKKVAKK